MITIHRPCHPYRAGGGGGTQGQWHEAGAAAAAAAACCFREDGVVRAGACRMGLCMRIRLSVPIWELRILLDPRQ
jgi:hypothetical protein